MDGVTLEMDLGMEFYEQWDWQRFREAESMELEEEDGGVVQTEVVLENIEEVMEREENIGGAGRVYEVEEGTSRRFGLAQYDGSADDVHENQETGSISKIRIDDVEMRSRQMDLPQYDGPVEEAEDVVSMLKTREEDIDIGSRHDHANIFTHLVDEALNENTSEGQEQRVVVENVELNKVGSGITPEKRDDVGGEGDGDGSISDFFGSENIDEEVVDLGNTDIPHGTHKNIPESSTTTTEMTVKSGVIVEADTFEKSNYFKGQMNDRMEDQVLDGETHVPEESHNDMSSTGKAASKMEVEPLIDKPADGEINGFRESLNNTSTLKTTCPEITVEAGTNANTNAHFEIEGHDAESMASGLLSYENLRNLEGKSSSMSILDQPPMKFTTQNEFLEKISPATEETTDANIMNAAYSDNMHALSLGQDFGIANQTSVNDESVQEDVELPPLPRMEAPVQKSQIEIPDSDAITESSQRSPRKLGHIDRTLDSPINNLKDEGTHISNYGSREEISDGEAEDIVSSFARECATSSIDPKKNLNRPETMGAKSLQNRIDTTIGDRQSIEIAPVDSAKKPKADSKSESEDKIEMGTCPSETIPQKKTNKRGRPPGRKKSGIVNGEGDIKEPIEKKAKLVEFDSDKALSMEAEDDLTESTPVQEKKKRGRPSSRKVSSLSVGDFVDQTDEVIRHSSSAESRASETSSSSPASDKRKRGRPSSRKASSLSVDELATEQEKATVDAPGGSKVAFIDKADEVTKHSSSKGTPTDDLSPNSPAPEKRKRGRAAVRKFSTLSNVTNDSCDVENSEKEMASMDEDSSHSNIGSGSGGETISSFPIPSMEEDKKSERPSRRRSSGLGSRKQDAEESGGHLGESNGVMAANLCDNADDVEELAINETMDELAMNLSSPVKWRSGKPVNKNLSVLSLEKGDTEEAAKENLPTVSVVILEDVKMNDLTPNHKSTDEFVTISSSSVKRKRGRPAGRKSSGIETENAEAEELSYKVSSLPHDDVVAQETTLNENLNDDLDDGSPVRPKKRGRPGRKLSQMNPEKPSVNEASENPPEDIDAEESSKDIINGSGNGIGSSRLADIGSSPVKRKEGGTASQGESEQSSKKMAGKGKLEGAPDSEVARAADIGIIAPLAVEQWNDEPPPVNPSSENRKRGGPGSRKASELGAEKAATDEIARGNPNCIVTQEAVNSDCNGPPSVNSTPEKRRRGRPSSRKSSSLIIANKNSAETVKSSPNDDVTPVAHKVLNADINEPATEASLSATSSPEKRKRGRPSRSASGFGTGSAKNMSGIDTTGKNIPPEIVNSDEEEDELQDESPPVKKVKPEPRKRGRPSGTKILGFSIEEKKTVEEGLTKAINTRIEGNETFEGDTKTHDEQPAQRKRRGRPAATKARDISDSDSEILEQEQQKSANSELVCAESEETVEDEADEQEELIVEKKRGRPTLLKNKGKEGAKTSESLDEDIITPSATRNSKGKVSGNQLSTSSNNSSSLQRQGAFLAEMKAMKLSSIQTRNANLRIEIAQKREKIQEITQGLEQPAKETVKRHIKLLHDYNDIKDVGQGLLGMIADNRGVRVGELYEEFGVDIAD
ncbi:predicted protein [Sclerotinia sclerotiorum 1980 UF-70]|uniref:DNA repair protein Swi5/Sae3 n=2 Tax=Sclerotinia sclerotiorum (strain ATCC 18683 / 1980 / Ss-1) TaxID=665079 RepID=A7EP16_SCLS1|nr:predicted protein [Sclerotinia sclerotiorum 1980 UF-70]APA10442.1 hypothetical protein sscle_06g052120 [Sclerotinia sclerotiorum 1980 UF-70]EDO04582.1 predicted protein [Sclerotinia sclerotiorum 1980 UF-70]